MDSFNRSFVHITNRKQLKNFILSQIIFNLKKYSLKISPKNIDWDQKHILTNKLYWQFSRNALCNSQNRGQIYHHAVIEGIEIVVSIPTPTLKIIRKETSLSPREDNSKIMKIYWRLLESWFISKISGCVLIPFFYTWHKAFLLFFSGSMRYQPRKCLTLHAHC